MSCCDQVVREQVSEYYGKELKNSKDLKTNSCTVASDSLTPSVKKIRGLIHDEVITSFYGCGSPIPPAISKCTIVDLGCGSGLDVFTCSALVGQEGKVIGVDMTEEQLAKARKYIDYHKEKFNLKETNVEFRKAFIEDLSFIESNSVDVVISNCVVNLSPEKAKVMKECFRVLKEGGELYFSDVYSDRRIPKELQEDKVLWGECLSGAMYIEDFRRLMSSIGFVDFRIVSSSSISVNNAALQSKLGNIRFTSHTIRAFKLSTLEDRCEDFGQKATYKGDIPDFPHAFFLDDHHTFITGYPLAVCGNTADMLAKTRYAPHFTVTQRGPHVGLFDCTSGATSSSCSSSSCC